jgi:hypothetical protein
MSWLLRCAVQIAATAAFSRQPAIHPHLNFSRSFILTHAERQMNPAVLHGLKTAGIDAGEPDLAIMRGSASVPKGATDHSIADSEVQAHALGQQLLISYTVFRQNL